MTIDFFKKHFFAKLTAVGICALMFLSSCRSSPPDFPPLPDIAEIGENAPVDPKEKERIRRELEEIARQPSPPYLINSGDIFIVKVYDNSELDMPDTVVTPDGELNIGLVGTVRVSGKTLPEATKAIENRLKEYIRAPKVLLVPRVINGQVATLAGKVQKSGRFPVTADMKLADLIALGQGMPNALNDGRQTELSDLASSIFVRKGRIIPVDFTLAMRGDPLNNVRVHSGDYVFIATRADKLISVIGEVKTPKYVTWYENIGLLEVFANTGGLKDEHADNAIVIRGGMANPKLYRVNISDVLTTKRYNPGLQPGDIVYVPRDGFAEYNVFIRKLMPTFQLINLMLTPGAALSSYML